MGVGDWTAPNPGLVIPDNDGVHHWVGPRAVLDVLDRADLQESNL